MFSPLPGRLSLGVSPERVVAVIESINTPNVSIPELGTEPTKAYLVGCLTPSNNYCIFCYLLFMETNRPIMWISNPPEVVLEQYGDLEGQAIAFVESMGFMLDNLNYRARPPHELMQLIEQLPFFRDQLPRAPSPSASTSASASALGLGNATGTPSAAPGAGAQAERHAVARLLASL